MAIIKDRHREQYKALVARVAQIDPEAAAYMGKEAKKLGSFAAGGRLDGAFQWDETPQGLLFWDKIYQQLAHLKEAQ